MDPKTKVLKIIAMALIYGIASSLPKRVWGALKFCFMNIISLRQVSKSIIQNMFQQHNLHRYRPCAFDFRETLRFLPTYYFLPQLNQLRVIPLNTGSIVIWSSVSILGLGVTTLGALYVFQCCKRRRYQQQSEDIIIDVDHSMAIE